MIYCISLRNNFLLNFDIATAVGSLFMLSEIYIKMLKKPVGIRFEPKLSVEFSKNGADQQLSVSWKW